MPTKLLKVTLEYEDRTMIAEGAEAEAYDAIIQSAASILHGRAYNPFANNQVKWTFLNPNNLPITPEQK